MANTTTEVLAVGTAVANGSAFTLTDGQSVTLCMKTTAGGHLPAGCYLTLQILDDGGSVYQDAGILLRSDRPPVNITAKGTYRVQRDTIQLAAVGAFTVA